MATRRHQPRRKKDDWLRAALEVFESEGIEGVRVERLARKLNVAKSGFYWHFRDRVQLYDDLLELWERESTQVVTSSAEIVSLPPADRLSRTAYLIWEHDLARFDLPFRAWAQRDPRVLARVDRVHDQRLSWIRQMFREIGFKGEDLEMRTRLFVGYHAWERTALPRQSKSQAKRMIKRRIALLVHPCEPVGCE